MDYFEQLTKLLDKYTQEELAERLSISMRSIQNYLSKSTTPHQKTIRLIDETYKQEFGNSSFLEQRRQQKTAVEPVMIPFIPLKAQAGYVRAIDQEMYLETLDKYALPPGVNGHGAIWRYWEIEGDSMLPQFRQGDIILSSLVHPMDWENIRNFYTYIIVTREDASENFRNRILFKRLYAKNDLEWVLISDNEEMYPQQLLPVEYVREVWVYRKTWGTRAEPPKRFVIKV